MPTGAGSYDGNGIWKYGEADERALASDLLNVGQASVSTRIGTIEGKLLRFCRGRLTTTDLASNVGRDIMINFPFSFATPPQLILTPLNWRVLATAKTVAVGTATIVVANFTPAVTGTTGVQIDWMAIEQ